MSTAATKAATKAITKKKINYGISYFKTRPKQIIVWIPPDMEQDSAIFSTGMLLINTEAIEDKPYRISQIPCGDYENDFNNFYAFHLSKYDDNTNKRKKYGFCWSTATGGVNSGYIIDEANNPKNITIMSVDMDEDRNITNIFALLTFSQSVRKKALKVHTLCSNNDPQVKKSGDGNKLLKFIQAFGLFAEINSTYLEPIDNAVPFYTQMGYRNETGRDAKETPPSSSASSTSSSPHLVMQRNNRTKRLFAKLRNSIHATFGLAIRQSKTREKLELQDRHKQMAKDAMADVPTKPPTLIPPPFTTGMMSGIRQKKQSRKIPSKLIVPGDSLKLAKARTEYKEMSDTAHRRITEEEKDES